MSSIIGPTELEIVSDTQTGRIDLDGAGSVLEANGEELVITGAASGALVRSDGLLLVTDGYAAYDTSVQSDGSLQTMDSALIQRRQFYPERGQQRRAGERSAGNIAQPAADRPRRALLVSRPA